MGAMQCEGNYRSNFVLQPGVGLLCFSFKTIIIIVIVVVVIVITSINIFCIIVAIFLQITSLYTSQPS
jgi:hypothetical protein